MRISDICNRAVKNGNLLNGGVSWQYDGKAYHAFCTVGDGYVEDGKLWTIGNMYEVNFYNHSDGVTIYKSNAVSIHYKCFTCGQTVELFDKEFFCRGCRVYEDLELEEIITKLVNRDFISYKTIVQNKDNFDFLTKMQQRLIKVLKHHNLIYWSGKQKKYVDMKYKEYGL